MYYGASEKYPVRELTVIFRLRKWQWKCSHWQHCNGNMPGNGGKKIVLEDDWNKRDENKIMAYIALHCHAIIIVIFKWRY